MFLFYFDRESISCKTDKREGVKKEKNDKNFNEMMIKRKYQIISL